MRRVVLLAFFMALIIVLALGSVALAHNAGPCADAGEPGNSDFAQHHIVPLAHEGDLGPVDRDDDDIAHNPGKHRGFSACNPSGR